ncbi:MAG TPA: mechanosensitive ion channel domain-containing protein [Ilumatobacteraceae bacterium]|nr:mechanosensitive ion channel domain-containing protein [Ilumatobacteraceae bacterium]
MTPAAIVLALLVGAVLVTRVSGFAMRRVVRRVANRSDANGRWWRAGASRIGLESADATEQRRRQRTDAAARMLNHLVSVVVWIGVSIAVFHLFDIDAAFFLSSAGFIGAAVAIGGQHKVNDYLTGLSVLFEDRYGVGDELLVDTGGERIHAIVDNIGLVTTRLRDAASTLHVPNAQLALVRNLSQEAAASTVRLRVPDVDGLDSEASAAEALRALAGSEQLTDVVFVGDLAAERTGDGRVDVAVRTVRPLDDRARTVLVERAERVLGVPR